MMNRNVKDNKNTIIVVVVLLTLIISVVVLGILNYKNITERRSLQENDMFLVTAANYTHTVTKTDILLMNPKIVSANYRDNIRTFTGIPLAKIFDFLDINTTNVHTVLITSLDGFTTILNIDEALDVDNTFVVFEEDGIGLGTREEGGQGPYMVIIVNDPFPNRWTKYLMEITLQ